MSDTTVLLSSALVIGINYVRLFNELPGARVVSVCDARVERLLEVKRRFPDVSVTTDLARGITPPRG